MLKFFRTIRRRLLDSGSLQKYFVYAIGEIMLVVIGILIALQINNWNESRKDNKLEQEYIVRLEQELQDNIQTANDQIAYSKLQFKHVDVIIDALSVDTLGSDNETLAMAIEHVGMIYPIQYDKNVWEELYSTGNIRLIHQDSLRDLLAAYHSEMSQTIELQAEYESYKLAYRRLVGHILDANLKYEISRKVHPTKIRNAFPLKGIPEKRYLIDQLKTLKELNGFLADIKTANRINSKLFEDFNINLQEMISICKRSTPLK
ncbi:MAG: hypothetical protein IPJ74_23900 [Saprospiraceae bacterium]|nr:hypothetical protein [Saprospiraceae bacterium]